MNIVSSISRTSSKLSVSVDEVDPNEWTLLLEQFEDANIYQTCSYGGVHWSARQLSHIVLKRDGRPVAVAQLRVVRIPLIKKGIAYTRWGPLCRLKGEAFDDAALQQIIAALKQEYVARRGMSLRMLPPVFESDPFAASFKSIGLALGLKKNEKARAYRTVRLDVKYSLEELRKRLNTKWRNKLNGAERNGLTVTEGTHIELYDRFLVAYGQLMSRKQFETTVDVAEFRKIQEQLPEPLKMQIFLCEKEGRLLNALVVSAIGDTAIYLLGATTDEGMKLKGAYLLQWRAIQWLKDRGCRWYDLGGINPETNPGVYEFKSGFGGEETFQLGSFELSGSWISEACVSAAERLRSIVGRWRARRGVPA